MRLSSYRAQGFTTTAMVRLIGRVVSAPQPIGSTGHARVYVETGREASGGVHEIVLPGAVAELCLARSSRVEAGAHIQLQGDLRADSGQADDGLWRWRAAVVAQRVKPVPAPDRGGPPIFNEVNLRGYVCSEIEVRRPFAGQAHPLWLEAVERVHVEVDAEGVPEHILVALSEEIGAHAKHRIMTECAVTIRGELVSGTVRDENNRARRVSAVSAKMIERVAGPWGLPPLPPMGGPGCTPTELELLWAEPLRGPLFERWYSPSGTAQVDMSVETQYEGL